MRSFLDFLFPKKKTFVPYGDMWLHEGESLNIYGDALSGKTTICLHIIKQFNTANIDRQIAYVRSEPVDGKYFEKLKQLDKNNINLIETHDISHVSDMIKKINFGLVIIDSLTALKYIDLKKEIDTFFKIVEEKKMNAIVVSQGRYYYDKETYEHKKILDFYAFKVKIEKHDEKLILNNNSSIKISDVWE